MDFKNIPVRYHPAYTWLWNSTATKEETARQIDEMYQNGIRAFYVLGEPQNFRPNLRRTFLKPDYMSSEYLDMVYFAYEYAKSKGMYTWLYNEGGFPSGMVCGQIRDAHPELALKTIKKISITLKKGEQYNAPDGIIGAFDGERRVFHNDILENDTQITQYICVDSDSPTTSMRTDISKKENTDYFLALTHEKLYKRFGEAMGSDVTMMFDDEASMGNWSDGFEKLFYDKYGYDITDFVPYIAGKPIDGPKSAQAHSDYIMLCGDLVRENYFKPMRDWLNRHNMLSVGHLGGDNTSDFPYITRHGNTLATLREYDVPGIDAIWSQITYPKDGKCCFEGFEFFPLLASSAARQQGKIVSLSESFAVYGAHLVPDEMRFIINFQAVQGINLFNFMVISYDRSDARSLQYRPNFIGENPGMDCLGQINSYTARLSCIMQSGKSEIKTALYFPQRTICAKGEWGKKAEKEFEQVGHMLMKKGVCFDIIDEEFVRSAEIKNGCLCGEFVTYENVFGIAGAFEPDDVKEKLEMCKSEISPCIQRTHKTTLARKLVTDDGDEVYFICNTHGEGVYESVALDSIKTPYTVNLQSGEVFRCPHKKADGKVYIELEMLCGEGVVILLSDSAVDAVEAEKYEFVTEISDFSSYISRKYEIHPTKGVVNTYFENGESVPLGQWDKDFSGEVTYKAVIEGIENGEYMLDMGEVRHYAKVYVNGIKQGEATLPPYRLKIQAGDGDELKIVVADTPANATHSAEFFNIQNKLDVGPYHENMKKKEKNALPGGLMNSVKIYKTENKYIERRTI
ncbi:MAG: hypothetical protein E7588_09775 [Ruminococcaceae bacterium]|nr:hypothetical protein [Oscillospiraceae bacterium]